MLLVCVYVCRAESLTLENPCFEEGHLSHSQLDFKRLYVVPGIKLILLTSSNLDPFHDIIWKSKKNTKSAISQSTAGKLLLLGVKNGFQERRFRLPSESITLLGVCPLITNN